jgi:hypothetical protein
MAKYKIKVSPLQTLMKKILFEEIHANGCSHPPKRDVFHFVCLNGIE